MISAYGMNFMTMSFPLNGEPLGCLLADYFHRLARTGSLVVSHKNGSNQTSRVICLTPTFINLVRNQRIYPGSPNTNCLKMKDRGRSRVLIQEILPAIRKPRKRNSTRPEPNCMGELFSEKERYEKEHPKLNDALSHD